VCRGSALQGFTWYIQTDPFPSPRRFILLVLGGAIANLAGLGASLLLWRVTGWIPLLLFAAANAILTAMALVPYSYAVPPSGARFHSDGALALARLLGSAPPSTMRMKRRGEGNGSVWMYQVNPWRALPRQT
ncbi:MAG TPA: hypothetical protein VM490_06910, partial [Armatimonadaceae bacterium]|nr:hypothetical protein [Armatimonadaceae bacterium]